MADYLDYGYNQYLQKGGSTVPNSEVDPLQFEQFTQDVPGDKMFSGLVTSNDGKVVLDLENNVIRISDGAIDRVTLGSLPDNTIGILIKDDNGNIIMQVSGEVNFIKSSDGTLEYNFIDKRILMRDDDGTPRLIIGEL